MKTISEAQADTVFQVQLKILFVPLRMTLRPMRRLFLTMRYID